MATVILTILGALIGAAIVTLGAPAIKKHLRKKTSDLRHQDELMEKYYACATALNRTLPAGSPITEFLIELPRTVKGGMLALIVVNHSKQKPKQDVSDGVKQFRTALNDLDTEQSYNLARAMGLAIAASTYDMFIFGSFIRNAIKLSFEDDYRVASPEAAIKLRSRIPFSENDRFCAA